MTRYIRYSYASQTSYGILHGEPVRQLEGDPFSHRETGAVDGTWKTSVKNGRANYVVGYHPLFMVCKCARRVFEWPYGMVAAGLLYGYLSGYFSSTERIREPDVISYVRREQLRRLFLRESIWAQK